MLTDVGEYLVGAYLQLHEECEVVDYNVRPPGGGLEGLGELDVVGFNFKTNSAFLCEVATHIRGLLYVNNRQTVERIAKNHQRQKEYARRYLKNFETIRYQFWSPVVPKGYVTENLASIENLEVIVNDEYADLSRKMAAALSSERPSPLESGHSRSWAAGIVYALGPMNFLSDDSREPHMTMSELCKKIGVSQSTASNKSREIWNRLDLM
jgi:hypothetical protein